MKKIDIHTHYMPERLPDWADFADIKIVAHEQKACCAKMVRRDGSLFREVESNSWDLKVRITEFEASGVSRQVLSTVPVLFHYRAKPEDARSLSSFLNDHLATAAGDFPERFSSLGTLPMQDVEMACREVERGVKDLGLCGFEIGTHIAGTNLNDPRFFELWDTLEKCGACVFVHPWEMMGENEMKRYWLPWLVGMPAETTRAMASMIFGGVFDRFKKLRVAFAHGGGSFAATFGRISHGFEVRPDLCAIDNPNHPKEALGRFWVDTLTHSRETLLQAKNLFGINRLMIGSDYPYPLGEKTPGALAEEMKGRGDFLSEEFEKVCWKNAEEWLSG